MVQYNSWKGGGLIAVSYEARMFGVKRYLCDIDNFLCKIWGHLSPLSVEIYCVISSSMRGSEAKEVCPEIQLVQVPVARGKADLSVYRNAGSEVKRLRKPSL